MNSTLPMVFNVSNYTMASGCLYDIAGMIQQLQSMPQFIFWIVLVNFILILLLVKIEQLFSSKNLVGGEEVSWIEIARPVLLFSIFLIQGTSLFFLFVFTFHPTNELLGQLQSYLLVLLLLMCVYLVWYYRKKFPDWFKRLKENELP